MKTGESGSEIAQNRGRYFHDKDLFGKYFATEDLRREYRTISHQSSEAIQVVYWIDPRKCF